MSAKEQMEIKIRFQVATTFFWSTSITFDDIEADTDVETDDSELADSDSGDPARFCFFLLRGRPFSLGAKRGNICI